MWLEETFISSYLRETTCITEEGKSNTLFIFFLSMSVLLAHY